MRNLLNWTGIVLGSLVTLVTITAGILVAISISREGTRYEVAAAGLEIPTDAESIAEGERLWVSRGCGDCHGADGSGHVVMDSPPARIVGTNLTVRTRGWSAEDHDRAIRHGVRPDGTPLALMPSQDFYSMSDADVMRIVAYYRSLPRRETELPATEINVLGRVLHGLGVFPLFPAEIIDHDAPRATPRPAETVEYGAYLVVGCTSCHGQNLSGGPILGAPPSFGNPANLTPHESGLGGWTREDFVVAMRDGRRPDGTAINPEQMPWRNYRRMTDVELHALYAYLSQLPPREYGNR